MQEILVAAERVADEDSGEDVFAEVPVRDMPKDGEQEGQLTILRAYKPGDGQVAAFMTTSAAWTSTPEKVAGAVGFLDSVLEEEDRTYLRSRLFDRHDPFGPVHVLKIIEALMEEWTGRPTETPSGSTPSRRSGGRKSTRPTPALT